MDKIPVRDYGGDGPPLILLHGAGGNLASMGHFPAYLAETFRVVAPDLRGHGRSLDDASWDWDGVLDDVQAVADRFGFARPYVAGISLGGMLATMWAVRHPDCPGAVSLDGNPPVSRPEQADDQVQDLDRLTKTFDAMEAAMATPLTEAARKALEEGHRALARTMNADEELFVEGLHRSIDGDHLKPGATLTRELRKAMNELDLMPAYRAVRCPLLLVLATSDMPAQEPFHQVYEAYRRYLRTQLSTLDNACVTVLPLEGASHAMYAERPRELAGIIAQWISNSQSE